MFYELMMFLCAIYVLTYLNVISAVVPLYCVIIAIVIRQNFLTDRSGLTVQTQYRVLLEVCLFVCISGFILVKKFCTVFRLITTNFDGV